MSKPYAQKVIEQKILNKSQNKNINYNEYSESYNDYNDLSQYYDIDYGVADITSREKAINIVSLFKNCGKLRRINIPKSNLRIHWGCFSVLFKKIAPIKFVKIMPNIILKY